MAFDKDKPAGSDKVSVSDDLIRANNAALETAIDEEHAFATGGTQTGRHSFMQDTSANISGASPSLENGGIAFSTDERSGYQTLQVRASGTMVNADVEPVDGSSNPTLPRVNGQSKFTVCQFGEWELLTISSGAVDIDYAASPYKLVTLTQNITLNNPTNRIANYGTTVLLDIAQDGTGGWGITTWGTSYRAAGGTVDIATGAGERTLVALTLMNATTTLVTSVSDWNTTIT